MFQQYYTSSEPETLVEEHGVLAVIRFNGECKPAQTPGIIPAGLEALGTHGCEVIKVAGDIRRGQAGRCQWSTNGELICSAIWIPEEECKKNVCAAAHSSYIELLGHLRDAGFPYPIRFWNFIPDINVGPGDREEYKKFCTGRLRAFTEMGLSTETFPAASALGHHSKGAVIYVLATKAPGQHHENPRQEKAYEYPRQYGPSSPSFSRATSQHIGNEKWVFISGTASILGHETRALGDIHDQLTITLQNLEILAHHIDRNPGPLTAIRVYLRHREDLQHARALLSERFPDSEVTYILADICRAELLVEIEAAFEAS